MAVPVLLLTLRRNKMNSRGVRCKSSLLAAFIVGVFSGLLPTTGFTQKITNFGRTHLVDGEWGLIHVHGSLVDSPCSLSLDTADQHIDIGMLSAGSFSKPGAEGQPVPFHFDLRDCVPIAGHQMQEWTEVRTADKKRPVVSMRFISPADPDMPSLIKLNGVQGIALKISDEKAQTVSPNGESSPRLLYSGDNRLVWYLTPVRTMGEITPGEFNATIKVSIEYD